MTPTPGEYLSVAIATMKDVIIPALDPAQQLPVEQAHLIVTTLTVLSEQWRHLDIAEEMELDLNLALAKALAALGDLPALQDEIVKIDTALAEKPMRYAAMEDSNRRLRLETSHAIETLSDGGSADIRQAVLLATMQHSEGYARLGRSRYRANRLDPKWPELPSLDEAIDP